MLYNPCWHFLVKLLTVVFALVSSDDLIRMASAEISHLNLCRDHTRVTETKCDTETEANVIFAWERLV